MCTSKNAVLEFVPSPTLSCATVPLFIFAKIYPHSADQTRGGEEKLDYYFYYNINAAQHIQI